MTKRTLALTLTTVLTLGVPSSLLAADDPTIQGKLRTDIQSSMKSYIEDHTVDGKFWHYDAVSGALLQLRFDELHAGIVKKGGFYVSCADFTDTEGRTLDLDFLVRPGAGGLTTVQGFVHKIGGETRPYDLNGSAQPEHPEEPEHPKEPEHPNSEHPK